MSVADQLREEGRRQGREEGRRAEIALLTRQLARRFGPLDGKAQALLDASTAADRLSWGERLLDAASLHEVFGAAWEP